MASTKALLTTGIVYLRNLVAGSGGATFIPMGNLETADANVGTDADTLEKNLFAYTLPANTLKLGTVIEIYAYGVCAANANVKTVRGYFGAATQTAFSGAVNGSSWWIRITVSQRATGNQSFCGRGGFAASNATATSTTIGVDETATILLRVTGQNGTAVANDLILHGGYVKISPAA